MNTEQEVPSPSPAPRMEESGVIKAPSPADSWALSVVRKIPGRRGDYARDLVCLLESATDCAEDITLAYPGNLPVAAIALDLRHARDRAAAAVRNAEVSRG